MSHPKLIFLGTRGSIPIEGPAFATFGGATLCILLRMADEVFVLDGGSGLLKLPQALNDDERRIHIFLSHAHMDHMIGLPMCSTLTSPHHQTTIWGSMQSGLTPLEQVTRLMSPPLWPVTPETFASTVDFQLLPPDPFYVGKVKIETMAGEHPNGATVFRFTYKETSVVYATDYEITKESAPRLAAFAKDCSLLLCDGQYAKEELPQAQGYGHSSWNDATLLAKDSCVKQLYIIHHAPWRSDSALKQAEKEMQLLFPCCSFAKSGEEINL